MPFRHPHTAFRAGFTLTELVVASVAASILLAALGSTMYIARQVAYSPVHAQKLLDGTNTAFGLVDELKHAIYVADYGATFVEFVIDDRDADAVEDTVRYAWSGTAGDPLTRSFNRGAPVNVMEDVHQFQLDYTIEPESESLEVFTPGGELPLESQGPSSGDSILLESGKHVSQKVDLIGLGASAESWSLTKILFEASQSGGGGQLAVQLRIGASDGTPTSEVLAEFVIPESSLPSSAAWYTYTPPQPVTGLSPHRTYCVVFLWLSGTSAGEIYLSNSLPAAYQTSDDGATWSAVDNKRAQVVVYAEPATASAPITVHKDRLRSVAVTLQHGDSGLSRIDTAVALDNGPVIVEKAWRAEFDRDPTQQDRNGDGDGDFDWSGGPFNMAAIVDGIWQASGSLRAENAASITTPVVIEVLGRSLGTGGRGLVARANVRLAVNEYLDVTTSIAGEPDGTQTATLFAFDGATSRVLTIVRNLPAKPLNVRCVVEPTRRLAALRVEGVDYPAVALPTVNAGIAADSFTISEDVANAEYDYASFVISH